ncbi:MAG: hypothetical protein WDM78_21350 [Puia sp.]
MVSNTAKPLKYSRFLKKTIENQLAIALKKISAAIHFDIGRSIPVIAGLH